MKDKVKLATIKKLKATKQQAQNEGAIVQK